MHIITVKGMSQEGAYDAERYATQLEAQGDPPMHVVTLKDSVAFAACERSGTRYTVISKEDLVIPPPKDDRI